MYFVVRPQTQFQGYGLCYRQAFLLKWNLQQLSNPCARSKENIGGETRDSESYWCDSSACAGGWNPAAGSYKQSLLAICKTLSTIATGQGSVKRSRSKF